MSNISAISWPSGISVWRYWCPICINPTMLI